MDPKKILLVEDDQFIRELYERQLKLAGFSVESSASGKEGKEWLDKNTYDLAILDLNLPDFSGFEILRHLQDNPKSGLIILVLSNVTEDEMVKKALDMGASAFIIKSTYTPAQVVSEVKSLLS